MKMYGNVINRLQENQKEMPTIEVGMGITEYLWSDRVAYEVVGVNSQKDILIRRYDVKNVGCGYGDNSWELISNENRPIENIVYRYGSWYKKNEYTQETIERMIKEDGCVWLNDDIVEEIKNKGVAYRYTKMNKLRFGVADYYYDFEF